MTKTSKLKVRGDFGGNEFAWGEDVQAAAAAAAKSLQSWFSNKERPVLSTSQAGFSRKKVMHTRARFPRPGNGRDTSLWFSGTVRQDRNVGCWKWNEKMELGWLAGREWRCLWRLPGKKQDTEAVPPGTWVLPFVLRTGDKISWRTGGAFFHALLWYHHRQNVKTVSPSIDEGLSLHDKLLREGINTLSFYLHCSTPWVSTYTVPHILSLESLLLAGEAITGVKNEFAFSFFLFFFLPHSVACGISVPQSGTAPVPPALEACSLKHQTTREAPNLSFHLKICLLWI